MCPTVSWESRQCRYVSGWIILPGSVMLPGSQVGRNCCGLNLKSDCESQRPYPIGYPQGFTDGCLLLHSNFIAVVAALNLRQRAFQPSRVARTDLTYVYIGCREFRTVCADEIPSLSRRNLFHASSHSHTLLRVCWQRRLRWGLWPQRTSSCPPRVASCKTKPFFSSRELPILKSPRLLSCLLGDLQG